MSNTVELSVLFPVHDLNNYFLDESISSIALQSFDNFEILFLVSEKVFDEFINYFAKFNFKKSISVSFFKIKLPGLAFALNLGLENAKGEFIARMDSDDISLPTRFEEQINFLRGSPNIAIVGCRVILIDSRGNEIKDKKFNFFETNEDIRGALPIRNPLCHPALIIRKAILFEFGGYQYGGYSEDHALFLKISRVLNHKFYNLKNTLFMYRRHDSQSTDFSNSWNAFYEISGFLFSEFLRTKNFKFILGIFVVYPPLRYLRNKYFNRYIKS